MTATHVRILLCLVLSVGVPACRASWKNVPHTVSLTSLSSPHETFERLLRLAGSRAAKIDFGPGIVTLIFVGGEGGVWQRTLAYRDIADVALLHNGRKNQWRVHLLDRAGERLFNYHARNEADAREFVDCIAALRAEADT